MVNEVNALLRGVSYERRKKLVQMASDDIIGEHGSQWLSACEISDTLNLSDEAMFSHFIGINDLHISVFEHFPKFHCDICLLSTFTVFHPRELRIP
jgi:hypothetical protein